MWIRGGNAQFLGRGTGSGHDGMTNIDLAHCYSGLEPPFSKRMLPVALGSLLFANGGSQKKKQAVEKK